MVECERLSFISDDEIGRFDLFQSKRKFSPQEFTIDQYELKTTLQSAEANWLYELSIPHYTFDNSTRIQRPIPKSSELKLHLLLESNHDLNQVINQYPNFRGYQWRATWTKDESGDDFAVAIGYGEIFIPKGPSGMCADEEFDRIMLDYSPATQIGLDVLVNRSFPRLGIETLSDLEFVREDGGVGIFSIDYIEIAEPYRKQGFLSPLVRSIARIALNEPTKSSTKLTPRLEPFLLSLIPVDWADSHSDNINKAQLNPSCTVSSMELERSRIKLMKRFRAIETPGRLYVESYNPICFSK